MASITYQSIRATVTIGGTSYSTPDVISFNVKRTRGQMCATASATVKASSSTISGGSSGGALQIKCNNITIFTGIITSCSANPLRTDCNKFSLSVSGKDMMFALEGQTFNRRLTGGTAGTSRFGSITSIVEDNSAIRPTFKAKQVSAITTGMFAIPKTDITYTPDAYGSSADRSIGKPSGGLVVNDLGYVE